MPATDQTSLKIELRRTIDAPPERVFAAWTTAELLRAFICPGRPGGAEVTVDARLGGRFHIDMLGEPGQVWPHDGEYLEFDPPRRLRFTWISLACPAELRSEVSIDFIARGAATEVILVHERLATAKDVEGHTVGWTAILEQLATAV
ncbi:MAG: SRPBCC domain-containing protein [Gemmatimonadales bacterium]